jgi:putative MATE family efflux protein
MGARTVLTGSVQAKPGLVRRVFTLAWPAVLEQVLAVMISLVDTFIVGHLGAAALAGVGLGGQLLNLSISLLGTVGVGSTALVARHIGAGEPDKAARIGRQSIMLATAIGVMMSLAGYIFAPQIIIVLGGEPDVVQLGSQYLRIVACSFVLIAILLIGNAVLRGAGDTRTPMTVMAIVNVINIVIAWTLTQGVAGLPRLGVVGTGLGAALGQGLGGLIVLTVLIRGRGSLRLGWPFRRPDRGSIRRILNIGLPAGAEQLMLQIALTSATALIANFGTAAYAAHQICWRIVSLSYLPGWGFAVAATTLVGQELGARRPLRALQSGYVAFRAALLLMSTMGILLFLFDADMVRLFSDDPQVVRQGAEVVRIAALLQPLMAASFVFSGSLRGAGDTRTTLAITLGSVWGLRIAITYWLGYALGLGLLGAWLAIGADFAFRAILFWRRFRSGRWQTIRV